MSNRTERFPQVRRLVGLEALAARLADLGVALPLDGPPGRGQDDPLASPARTATAPLTNRFAILPMEGWDGTADGRPSELTTRRWRRFGSSGAALIWGGEAVAVHPEGRANPNQLVLRPETATAIGELRLALLDEHRRTPDAGPPPQVGLQLTHSGRFSRPRGAPAPRLAWPHPVLDRRIGLDAATAPDATFDDAELDALVGHFTRAAALAWDLGFDFVDIKACHGYLLHELLGARARPGPYGGTLEGRSRLLTGVLEAVRDRCPGLGLAVRLSVFDDVAYTPGPSGAGVPDLGPDFTGRFADEDAAGAVRGDSEVAAPPRPFGAGRTVGTRDASEPHALATTLQQLGVSMICVTGGSPYYNPHLQRPAYFPPSDGYDPPEDPLVGVARLLGAARDLRHAVPGLVIVGSGFSYLQEHLPAVARGAVREGWMDLVGLGRMALSYPHLPRDVLARRPLERRLLCRTFSDCTTAPRNGMVSGCFPLDPFYRNRPERAQLVAVKRRHRTPDS